MVAMATRGMTTSQIFCTLKRLAKGISSAPRMNQLAGWMKSSMIIGVLLALQPDVGEPLADYDHQQTTEQTEQRPEADQGITEKVRRMTFDDKIEDQGKQQKGEKTTTHHSGTLAPIIDPTCDHEPTINLIVLRKRSGQMPISTEISPVINRGTTISNTSGCRSRLLEAVSAGKGVPKNDFSTTGTKYPAFSRLLSSSTSSSTRLLISMVPSARYHLLTKPLTGGTPIMLKEARAKAAMVRGMRQPRPPISEISFLP